MRKSTTRGWLALISCILANLVCCGFIYNQMSLLLEPISTSLGISRTLLSSLQSLTPIVNTIITMFFMKFHDKMGLRLMMLAGCACVVIFSMLYYFAGVLSGAAVVLIALAHILIAFTMSWSTAMTANIVITNWFAKNIGSLMSIYGTSGGIGGVIAAPVVSRLISSFGWQSTTLYFAGAAVVALMLAVLFFKTMPAADETKIWEGREDAAVSESVFGLTFDKARKTKNYLFCVFICLGLGVFLYPPMMVLAPYCADCGVAGVGGTAMSVLFAVQILVTLPLGGLVEKYGLKAAIMPVFLLVLVALCSLVVSSAVPALYFAAVGFGAGMAVVNVLIGLLTRTVFGNRDFARIQSKL
ncbi:MAG: MFS transporter [Oscillospiraceae bacterium]|nr:MFS transporter [Oscillospiraceae bacterium]